MGPDDEFKGQALLDLVCSVEAAVGSHRAGATPLGRAVINLCEDALTRDRADYEAAQAGSIK